MSAAPDLPEALQAYARAVRTLALKPAEYFGQLEPSEALAPKAMLAAPPVLVYSAGMAIAGGSAWLLPLCALGALSGIALWALILKHVLRFFGERRSYRAVLDVVASSCLPLTLGWIPHAGAPLSCLGLAVYNYMGLTRTFKMHQGAALAAISLPVVAGGLGGSAISFVLLWIASLSTIFSR